MTEALRPLGEGLWTVERAHGFLGIDVGGRMNVIKLSSGGLLLHSPVLLTGELKEGLESLGEVKYVAAPNRFHHIHIGDYVRAYPGALFLAAPGLQEKRRDIQFTALLGGEAPPEWEGEIEHFVFGGMPLLNEAVFFHKPSLTLILTDLMFNFSRDLTAGQRLFAALEGVSGRPSASRLMRYFMMKDRAAVRRSAGKVLEWDFGRVLLVHKDMIDRGGKEAVRLAFEDL